MSFEKDNTMYCLASCTVGSRLHTTAALSTVRAGSVNRAWPFAPQTGCKYINNGGNGHGWPHDNLRQPTRHPNTPRPAGHTARGLPSAAEWVGGRGSRRMAWLAS